MFSRQHSSMEDILPDNVMCEVISRLPVKTIIRCKCVCKKWRDLVSDSYFVHLHLSRSRDAALMILTTTRPGILKWVELGHEAENPCVRVKWLDLMGCAPVADYYQTLVGSVNGLICSFQFSNEDDQQVVIFNPVLEEHMILPQPRQDLSQLGYGFGVSRGGEYKVIRICARISSTPNLYDEDKIEAVEIEVYTLGTGQWRILGQTPLNLNLKPWPNSGVFVNSHVYWLGDDQIYDFDLNTETFELFPSPPGDNRESEKMLGVLKGRLSRVSWCSLGLEVWVMKEESWSKEITLQEDICHLSGYGFRPVCLFDGLKGASILMASLEGPYELIVHCLTTNTNLHLKIRYYGDPIRTYSPSFVKLSSFGLERVDAMYGRVRKISTLLFLLIHIFLQIVIELIRFW
ncbi:putative F-box domain-containing protein [Helianthus annuus]|nr:putative F-box domain-containing protein [Helianthus annuus]